MTEDDYNEYLGEGVKCPACGFISDTISGDLSDLESGDPCPECGYELRWLDWDEIYDIYKDYWNRED